MEVNKIAASIRFSKDIGGSWKSVELGAEATVSDREFWKQAQSELYYQLTDQLRTLWSNGSNNGNGAAALNGAGGAESHVAPPATSEPTQSHGSIGAKSIRPSSSGGPRPGWSGTATGKGKAGAMNPNPLNKGGEVPDMGWCPK